MGRNANYKSDDLITELRRPLLVVLLALFHLSFLINRNYACTARVYELCANETFHSTSSRCSHTYLFNTNETFKYNSSVALE